MAPGETVALVGASGSGKTSLVNLIPRFYEPTAGRLFIDGHDVSTLQRASLRAQIAMVSQDVLLFNDTIAANIAYGAMSGASRDAVERAASAAHALDFIRLLPQGFDTLVGEHGMRLSGGQRQRIAIARALLKNAPLLILDEATSALDSESERQVQAALEALMRGRTTIVIAHRLSTIEHADRIVVLEHGRIVETGTHRELLQRDRSTRACTALQMIDSVPAVTEQSRMSAVFADVAAQALRDFHDARIVEAQSAKAPTRRCTRPASGTGSRPITDSTRCCGTRRTWRAASTSATPRLPPTSARSTATTRSETTRSNVSTRRCSPASKASHRWPARGTTPRQPAR